MMAITPAAMPPMRLGGIATPATPHRPGQHEHAWRVAGLQPSPHRSGETIALIICDRCREPRTNTLTGTWTLDQINGI